MGRRGRIEESLRAFARRVWDDSLCARHLGDHTGRLRSSVVGLAVGGTLLTSAIGMVAFSTAASAHTSSITIDCTQVKFVYESFPAGVSATSHESVTVDGRETAIDFTFTGPASNDTMPMALGAGTHLVVATSRWSFNGAEQGNASETLELKTCAPAVTSTTVGNGGQTTTTVPDTTTVPYETTTTVSDTTSTTLAGTTTTVGDTSTTTMPENTTSTTVEGETTTTIGQQTTTTTAPETTTTTVPETTTTTVPETTTTAPETTTTAPETTTTVPESTTSTTIAGETTTTIGGETTTTIGGQTTTTFRTEGSTSTTSVPSHGQGSTTPSTVTTQSTPGTGSLPFTGSNRGSVFGALAALGVGSLAIALSRRRVRNG